jgi:hypothetical protein
VESVQQQVRGYKVLEQVSAPDGLERFRSKRDRVFNVAIYHIETNRLGKLAASFVCIEPDRARAEMDQVVAVATPHIDYPSFAEVVPFHDLQEGDGHGSEELAKDPLVLGSIKTACFDDSPFHFIEIQNRYPFTANS